MKRTFFSKTVSIIGLTATLAAVVGPGVQQVAQAQSAQGQSEEATAQQNREYDERQNQERIERSLVRAVPDFCPAVNEYTGTGDPEGLPPVFFDDEGNFRSYDFAQLESALTPEVLAVFKQAERRLSKRAALLNAELSTDFIPNAPIEYFPKDGFSSTDAIVIEISAALDAANKDQIPNPEQLDAFVKKYGQYGDIRISRETLYTPEQFLETQSIEREFAATVASAFTGPEEREYYLRNVDAREAMKSCYPNALLTASNRPNARLNRSDDILITLDPTDSANQSKTIVATAIANGSLDTLVSAVQAAGLVDTLNAAGPYTVFAPTDEAFAALPAGVLDKLLLPENKETLTKILTYHMIADLVPAGAIQTGPAPSVEGANLNLTNGDRKVTVNGANVVQANVATINGVIHVIDAVLLPPDLDLSKL